MGIIVTFPQYLRDYAQTADVEEVDGTNVLECLQDLELKFPKLKGLIYESGSKPLLKWMIYKNGSLLSSTRVLDSPLADGDEISLIPLVAGG